MALHAISICSGIGGLDLGLRSRGVRTVCYVEREAFAAATLVKAMEEGRLDPAPIWSDVATFDASAWRGRVDLVFGGIPCQPWSNAGKRKGHDDERDLLAEAFRVFDEAGASLLFLENVGGFRRALPRLLEGAAARGLDAVWDRFTAAEVGAPHRRQRYFVLLADADRARLAQRESEPSDDEPERKTAQRSGRDGAATDADHQRRESERGTGLQRQRLPYANGRDVRGGTFRERRPAPEPVVRRMDDGTSSRVDRLRALGNGVVPQQAALAWDTLWERLV